MGNYSNTITGRSRLAGRIREAVAAELDAQEAEGDRQAVHATSSSEDTIQDADVLARSARTLAHMAREEAKEAVDAYIGSMPIPPGVFNDIGPEQARGMKGQSDRAVSDLLAQLDDIGGT